MKRIFPYLVMIGSLAMTAALPALATWQASTVTAEAIGQANLRATADVTADLIGQIVSGTRYPIIGQSQFYPWVLLGDPTTGQPMGWVFKDLVAIQGDLSTVPFSLQEVSVPALVMTPTLPAPADMQTTPSSSDSIPSLVAAGTVTGLVLGEINLRYGPGVEYPRVAVAQAGERFEIAARHTQLPWVQIRYPTAPGGVAWVALELLDIEGDLSTVPSISQTRFNLPTLTPTPSAVQASFLLGAPPVEISPSFKALGEQIFQMMLNAEFDLSTSRMGALFLMDLKTGEAVTFGNDIAFSGMSLSKISILTDLYNTLDSPPDSAEAVTIAEAMICSENISSNEMLGMIGGGNPFVGAQAVTEFLQTLGLDRLFITAPFDNDPFITPQPVSSVTTSADQQSAEPDPFNQVTVDQLGWLLGSVYQCAYQEGGALLDKFPQTFEPRECRQMLRVMSSNRINALIEMGLPESVRVAHKHGWVADTHGDAGVVFTPGGDYVLVVILRNPTWIDYSESFPLIAEISRLVYNYYNPDVPLDRIREGTVTEDCNLLGNPVIEDLMSITYAG